MPKKSRFFGGGFIDVLSLVAVVFLVATVITGTLAVNNRKANYNIQEKAACMDPCTTDADCAGGEYCYRPATGCSICKIKVSTPAPSPTSAPITTTVTYTCTQTSGQYCSRGCSYSAGSGTCQTGQVCCKTAPAPTPTLTPLPTPPPQCSANQIKCSGSGQLYSCYAGTWIIDVRCPSQTCNSTGTACGIVSTPTPTRSPTPSPVPTYTCTQTSGQYCSRDCTYGSGSGTCQTGQVCCKPADPNLVCSIQGQVKCVGSQLYNCSSGYWYPGANCASGSCNATGTACTPLASCITTNGLGSTRCKTTSTASYVETCLGTGTWSISSACSGTCTNGVCSNCADKPNICNNAGGVNYCQNGKYYSKNCDPGTACIGGQCIVPTTCVARDVCLKEGQSCCPGIDKVRASGCSTGLKCGSCLAGQTKCSTSGTASYSETCQTDGSWIKASCTNGCSDLNGQCSVEEGWKYVCSPTQEFAYFVQTKSLGVDWARSLRCSNGCLNGSCKGTSRKPNECSKGQISQDGFEECINDGFWRCIPGKTRTTTIPGQTNMDARSIGCDKDRNTFTIANGGVFLNSLKCSENTLKDGKGNTVKKCPVDSECLNQNSYLFVNYSGCYPTAYIENLTCKNNDKKVPRQPNECEATCINRNWVNTLPPKCIRDPSILYPTTCSFTNGKTVRVNHGRIIEACSNGCLYGQCLPKKGAGCNEGDAYISSAPECLVKCISGVYKRTNTCVADLKLNGNWSGLEILELLKTADAFPSIYKKSISQITFYRYDQPYATDDLASGYYQNSYLGTMLKQPGKIVIPDTGTSKSVYDHELIHYINDMEGHLAEFKKVSGCRQDPTDPNGPYQYYEAPYRDYGATNCDEGLAVSCGEEYMDPNLSCAMKNIRPKTYNYCRDVIFKGTEYCSQNKTSGYMINKYMQVIAKKFNFVVHASDNIYNIASNGAESKLAAFVINETNEQTVISTLGKPLDTIQAKSNKILTYPSSDISKPHIIYINGGVVTFVQIVFDSNTQPSVSSIIQEFGEPENKSYSTHSINSPVYSYPSKGLSFIIDGSTNKVLMVQKFTPMSEEQFKRTVGKNFKSQQYGDTFQGVNEAKASLAAQINTKTSTKPTPNKHFPIVPVVILVTIVLSIVIFFLVWRILKNRKEKVTHLDILPPEQGD